MVYLSPRCVDLLLLEDRFARGAIFWVKTRFFQTVEVDQTPKAANTIPSILRRSIDLDKIVFEEIAIFIQNIAARAN